MEYKISVLSVCVSDLDDMSDVVRRVGFSMTLSDGDLLVRAEGQVNVWAPNPDSFIAFEDLTEDLVISWLEANDDTLSVYKTVLEYDMTRMKAEAGLQYKQVPWVNWAGIP